MTHPLCMKCMHKCKQKDTVTIVHCPKFQKRLSDSEFRNMIDDLKVMETKADELKERARKLIQNASPGEENSMFEDITDNDDSINSKS